ncbi:MAG: dihydroneopterin aldolase [Candidatus Marinimicrobia bacterium]|nr:dihydroneopterin aldolase [Candidatus Neomarinimicrobiota bacterium]
METKIKINNIQLFGYHGIDEQEKSNGQLFEIDIEASPISNIPISDDLSKTVDYTLLYDEVTTIFSQRRYNLIEYLAIEISNTITNKFNVNTCKVVIRKPNAPIKGDFDSVEVEVITDV